MGCKVAGEGSGVIYKKDGKEAYIVTNNHVVDGAKKLEIMLSDGSKITGELVGKDTYSDLAVVKVSSDKIKTVAEFADSNSLTVGEKAIAIGSPLGTEYANSVTEGIVSSLSRTVTMQNDNGETVSTNAIQTDAAINPGNSGGALVNMKGELVGITNMKFSDESVEGMGFAIPINDVITVAEQIRSNGKVSHPVIGISGVSLNDYSSYELQRYGVKVSVDEGIYVVKVTSDGAANKAGIQQGDVIVKLDGKDITTYKSFLTALYSHKAGDKVKVVVNRSGSEKTITVTLQEK